jgi:hypothetical protein
MTTVTIDESGSMPVGELLRQATDQVVELRSPAGALLATMYLEAEPPAAEYADALQRAEQDIEELRRRRRSPKENDLTTAELLSRLAALDGR